MSEPENYTDLDADRVPNQEPAEGAEEPGEVNPSLAHTEEPAEGEPEAG